MLFFLVNMMNSYILMYIRSVVSVRFVIVITHFQNFVATNFLALTIFMNLSYEADHE
jgi:hypothetical protein